MAWLFWVLVIALVIVFWSVLAGLIVGEWRTKRACQLEAQRAEAQKPLPEHRVYCVDCRFFRWDTDDDLQCVAVLDRGKPSHCETNAQYDCPHWQADEEDKNVE